MLVCSLAGGTGRTTVAAQLAALLAGLPFAHIWPPALLVDAQPAAAPHPAEPDDDQRPTAGDERGRLPVGSTLRLRTTSSGVRLLQPPPTGPAGPSRHSCGPP